MNQPAAIFSRPGLTATVVRTLLVTLLVGLLQIISPNPEFLSDKAAALQSNNPAISSSVQYGYDGTLKYFVVPQSVYSISITMKGGAGGKGGTDTWNGGHVGKIGQIIATIAVRPGDTITIAVGSGGVNGDGCVGPAYASGSSRGGLNPIMNFAGGNGSVTDTGCSGNGGGGGAATVVFINGKTQIIAPGGGGSAGGNNEYFGDTITSSLPYPAVGMSTTVNGRTQGLRSTTTAANYYFGNGGNRAVTNSTTDTTTQVAVSGDGGQAGGGGGGYRGGVSGDTKKLGTNEYFGFGGSAGSFGLPTDSITLTYSYIDPLLLYTDSATVANCGAGFPTTGWSTQGNYTSGTQGNPNPAGATTNMGCGAPGLVNITYAPTPTVVQLDSSTARIYSNSAGSTVYLVRDTATVASVSDLTTLVSAGKGASASIATAGGSVDINISGIPPGRYVAYAIDSDGVLSSQSVNSVYAGAGKCGSQTTSGLNFSINYVSNFCIITFTNGVGTWTVPDSVTSISFLAVGGGAGGGADVQGAGGGGEIRYDTYAVVTSKSSLAISIGVGGRGGSHTPSVAATIGTSSTISGGGLSVTANPGSIQSSGTGGSGGTGGTGGFGINGAKGGNGTATSPAPNACNVGTAGDTGTINSFSGSIIYYGDGGGGNIYVDNILSGNCGGLKGGSGNGGTGAKHFQNSGSTSGGNGAANTGAGGGAGAAGTGGGIYGKNEKMFGGDGGSGVVVIRYIPFEISPIYNALSVIRGVTDTYTAYAKAPSSFSRSWQWQVSSNNGSSWSALSNSSSSGDTGTYSLANQTISMNGYIYRAIITDSQAPSGTTATSFDGAFQTNSILVVNPVTDNDTDTALYVDGNVQVVSTYGAIPNSTPTPTSSWTIEVWVKPTTTCSSTQNVFQKDGMASIYCSGSNWYYDISTNVSGTYSGTPQPFKSAVRTGVWQHLALSNNAGTVTSYFNGQLSDGAAVATTMGTGSTSVYVGCFGVSNCFNGTIDEVKVWSTARASNIATDMDTYTSTSSAGLLYYWDFNEGSASRVFDRIPTANGNSDLRFTGTGSSTLFWPTVESVTISDVYRYVEFDRSYLTAKGGWKIPTGTRNATALVVGGGGGGANNTGSGGAGGGVALGKIPIPGTKPVLRIKVGVGGTGSYYTGNSSAVNARLNGVAGLNTSISYSDGSLSVLANGGAGGLTHWSSNQCGGTGDQTGLFASGGTVSQVLGMDTLTVSGGGRGGKVFGSGSNPATNSGEGGQGISATFIAAHKYGPGGGTGSWGTYGGLPNRGLSGGDINTVGAGGASAGAGSSPVDNYGAGGGGGGDGCAEGGAGSAGVVMLRYVTTIPTGTNPSSLTINEGDTPTFSISSTPVAGLNRTYQWQYQTTTSANWFNALDGIGYDSSTYSLPRQTNRARTLYKYRVLITDTGATSGETTTTYTDSATLTVKPAGDIDGDYSALFSAKEAKSVAPLSFSSSSISTEVWVNSATTCSGASASYAVDFYNVAALYCKSGNWYGSVYSGSSDSQIIFGESVTANVWHHLAMTQSGTTLYAYYDGQEVESLTGITFAPQSSNYLSVASPSSARSGATQFSGNIDELRFWTSSRRDTLTADLHTVADTTSASLFAYYSFNETGTSIHDRDSGSTGMSDLIPTGSQWTWQAIETSTIIGTNRLYQFPRTIITSQGGWALPKSSSSPTALIVGGGGGGTGNAGYGGAGGGLLKGKVAINNTTSRLKIQVGVGGVNSYSVNSADASAKIIVGGTGGSSSISSADNTVNAVVTGGAGGPNHWKSNVCQNPGSNYSTYYTATPSAGGSPTSTIGITVQKSFTGTGGGLIDPAQGAPSDAVSGIQDSITGTTHLYGGGGGSGGWNIAGSAGGGDNGNAAGGTGNAGGTPGAFGQDAYAYYGGGGGGGGDSCQVNGGRGAIGVVYLLYPIASMDFINPTDTTSVVGGNATFTIGGSPSGDYVRSYLWQVETVTGTTWANLSNSIVESNTTTSTLLLKSITDRSYDGNRYRAQIIDTKASTGESITAYSDSATLTVNRAKRNIRIGSAFFSVGPFGVWDSFTAVAGELTQLFVTDTSTDVVNDTWTVTSGSCSISATGLILSASTGTCVVNVIVPQSTNYLTASDTRTIVFIAYVAHSPFTGGQNAGGSHTIILGFTSRLDTSTITTAADSSTTTIAPVITSITQVGGGIGTGWMVGITIVGSNFWTTNGSTTITFGRNLATRDASQYISNISPTQIIMNIPDSFMTANGFATGTSMGRAAVITPAGEATMTTPVLADQSPGSRTG